MNEQMLTPVQSAHVNPALEFRDGQCMFRMVTTAGTTVERFISWEAVREAALAIPVDSGWITPEIRRHGTGRLGDWAVAFIPPGRHRLEITSGVPGPDEKIEHVTAPLPGLAMFGISNKYWVWAVKTDDLDPHRELYRAPLPNVMQDGAICWGLLRPPQASPRAMLRAWQVFIGSTFNNHAAPGKSKRKPEDVRELLRELAEMGYERYPVEDLLPFSDRAGVTLDLAIKSFFEMGAMHE
jgi:hypothetical protein